jgi:hypothetical protein
MNRNLMHRPLAAVLAGAAILVTAATATGAGNSITLNLKGGRSQQKTACGAPRHYAAYRKGSRLRMEGYVSPAPALPDGTWRVKIKIKQCKSGRFVPISETHVFGKGILLNGVKVGEFRMTYRMRRTGYFFARAYYYGYSPSIISQDDHFHVTR